MKIKRKMLALVWVMFILMSVNTAVTAQIRVENIRDDIRIMETILDKLLQSSREFNFDGWNFKGLYFDNYGLLFTADLNNRFRIINLERLIAKTERLHLSQEKLYELSEKAKTLAEKESEIAAKVKEKDKTIVVPPAPDAFAYSFSVGDEESKENFNQWLEKLDQKIQTFLGTYVDVNDLLLPNERISIVFFLGNSEEKSPRARIYQTYKKDITDYRKEKVSKTIFLTKVAQQLVTGDTHAEEIDVMCSILATVVYGKKGNSFVWGNQINGIYLQDLGVMFNIGNHWFSDQIHVMANTGVAPELTVIENDRKRTEVLARIREQHDSEKKQYREKLSKLEDDIIRLIGDYGPSLRFLPDEQSVFVVFDSDAGFGDEESSNIMIRIGKTDVLAYSRNQIDQTKLRSRAQIIKY